MKIIVKDITGEVYESPDMSREDLDKHLREFPNAKTDEDVAHMYRVFINSIIKYAELERVTVNVGTLDEPREVVLNPAHIVSLQIENRITEWEDESDTATIFDEPSLWS